MNDPVFHFGPFELRRHERSLRAHGQAVRLGSRAFDLLVVLIENAGTLVTNQQLMDRVWANTAVEDSNLRVHVTALRKVLGEAAGGNPYIKNVPLKGYILTVPVSVGAPIPSATSASTERPVASPLHRRLPLAVASIFGRTEVVNMLVARTPVKRLVSIVGAGGAGKTTVAIAAAQQLAGQCRDGICFVDLATLDDPKLVASTVATLLNLPIVGNDPTLMVARYLADKQMLLVLDNCEHVIDAAAELAEKILRLSSDTLILTTSREPLRVQGEWVHRLGPLEVPPERPTLSPAAYLAYPSVQLFVSRASANSDDFDGDSANMPAVATICRRLDGIPLAIELAAARVESFGVQGLCSRLDEHLFSFSGGRRTAPARHKTLRAMLDWSYQTLETEEQATLRRLSVFQAPFPLHSAVEILGQSHAPSTLQSISNLVLKSLLVVDISGDDAHYRMLETTRAFGGEQLDASDERQAFRRRHAEHFAKLMAGAQEEWVALKPSAASWVARYEHRLHDLRAALDWAFSPHGDARMGCRLTADTALLWYQLSLAAECRLRTEKALACLAESGEEDTALEMRLLAVHAQVLVHAEGPGSAKMLDASTRALDLAREIGDRNNERQMLFRIWNGDVVNGNHLQSLERAQQYADITQENGSSGERALVDRMLMLSHHVLGNQGTALVHSDRLLSQREVHARDLRSSGFETDHKVMALVFRARMLWLLGRPDQAWETAREAVAEALEIDHTLTLMYALSIAASTVAIWRGDFDAVDRYVGQIMARAVPQSLHVWAVWGRGFDSALLLHGHVVTASRPRLPHADSLPFHTHQQEVFATTVEGFLSPGVIKRVHESPHTIWCSAEVLRCQAVAMLAQSPASFEAVESLLHQSASLAEEHGSPAWQLRTATSHARLLWERGQDKAARDLLDPILGAFREGENTRDLLSAAALLRQLRSAA